MADISDLVSYDKTYPVELTNVNTGEPLDIVFNVVSFDSDRVVSSVRKLEAERWADDAAGVAVDFAEYIAKQERVRILASIDSWEFRGHSWGSLGADPACTPENKAFIVNAPNAKWVRDQIALKAANIANFMQALPKPVRTTSKKT
jgi:hypothetical protein